VEILMNWLSSSNYEKFGNTHYNFIFMFLKDLHYKTYKALYERTENQNIEKE